MSTPSSADGFLKRHLDTFGILGTNNRVPDHLRRQALPPLTFEFTKGNHFRFGYNDGEFNSRTVGSAVFWVEFGRVTRKHEGLRSEIRRALLEMQERYGALSISNSGNAQSRAIIAEAKEAGIDLEQVTIELETFPFPKHDPDLPNRHVKVTWEDFCKFAREFSAVAGNGDPWVALEAYHGQVAERTHLLSHARINVLHNGYDSARHKVVDAPIWSVVDYEQSTAPNRWLLANGRVGIPAPLYWSPELMAAQLDAPVWKDRMRRASVSPPELEPTEARWNTVMLLRRAYPKVMMAMSAEAARNSNRLRLHMKALRHRLRRANSGCIAMHGAPLHRLLEQLGVVYDLPSDDGRKIFGDVVLTAPPSAGGNGATEKANGAPGQATSSAE